MTEKCNGCKKVSELQNEVEDLKYRLAVQITQLASLRAALAMSESAKLASVTELLNLLAVKSAA
jgi:hypothetical protein